MKQVKAFIEKSDKLGNIPVEQQRIFHLGRELKTNGRSLATLGVGRMGITVLHVHAAPPKKGASTATACLQKQQRRFRAQQQQQRNNQKPAAAGSSVVDLAGDDTEEDDDDDDDCVIVDEVATANAKNKRARRCVKWKC